MRCPASDSIRASEAQQRLGRHVQRLLLRAWPASSTTHVLEKHSTRSFVRRTLYLSTVPRLCRGISKPDQYRRSPIHACKQYQKFAWVDGPASPSPQMLEKTDPACSLNKPVPDGVPSPWFQLRATSVALFETRARDFALIL